MSSDEAPGTTAANVEVDVDVGVGVDVDVGGSSMGSLVSLPLEQPTARRERAEAIAATRMCRKLANRPSASKLTAKAELLDVFDHSTIPSSTRVTRSPIRAT